MGGMPNLSYLRQQFSLSLYIPPPLQKYYRQFFLFVELISLALPEKLVMWLPEIIPGELIVMGLPESLAGSYWGRPMITGNIGNAITGKYSGGINLEQLPEKSVIGSLWLPEKMFGELIW